jgi:hypothetical protein
MSLYIKFLVSILSSFDTYPWKSSSRISTLDFSADVFLLKLHKTGHGQAQVCGKKGSVQVPARIWMFGLEPVWVVSDLYSISWNHEKIWNLTDSCFWHVRTKTFWKSGRILPLLIYQPLAKLSGTRFQINTGTYTSSNASPQDLLKVVKIAEITETVAKKR